ncbi:STAS domain-containing protein [Catellatospora methionotrophica]|uniref:STAS domain-containing protein n=1 Tax=Catellatospora methionotrophica TaxID=121620 RepID=UPI0034072DA0
MAAGLLAAVATGVLATLVLVLRELDQPQLIRVSPTRAGTPPDAIPPLVLRVETYLYTANITTVQRDITGLVSSRQPAPAAVMLEMRAQTQISTTVLDRLNDLDRQLSTHGAQLWIIGLLPRAAATARRTHWWAV